MQNEKQSFKRVKGNALFRASRGCLSLLRVESPVGPLAVPRTGKILKLAGFSMAQLEQVRRLLPAGAPVLCRIS